MGTTSNRSSGTQVNQRGVAQGNTLVDPVTGFPVDVINDGAGKRRLCVDANVSLGSVTVNTRDLSATTDNVGISDQVTGNKLLINPDGSIDTNVAINATSDKLNSFKNKINDYLGIK